MSVALASAPSSAATSHPSGPSKSSNPQSSAGVTQVVCFRLATEEYGIDIMRAQEIIIPGAITRMPEVPDYVLGLINLRGHVIPVVDLRRRFGLAESEIQDSTRIVVVNVGGKTIGMIVDAVTEVLRISADQMEPAPPGVSGIGHEYIRGLAKLTDKLLILLNIENVLTDEQSTALVSAASNTAAP